MSNYFSNLKEFFDYLINKYDSDNKINGIFIYNALVEYVSIKIPRILENPSEESNEATTLFLNLNAKLDKYDIFILYDNSEEIIDIAVDLQSEYEENKNFGGEYIPQETFPKNLKEYFDYLIWYKTCKDPKNVENIFIYISVAKIVGAFALYQEFDFNDTQTNVESIIDTAVRLEWEWEYKQQEVEQNRKKLEKLLKEMKRQEFR
jgi:hypothetical protein